MVAGDELLVKEGGLFNGSVQVLRLSAKFMEQMAVLKSKGYAPSIATIRHMVFWRDEELDKEIKIILPNIEFAK